MASFHHSSWSPLIYGLPVFEASDIQTSDANTAGSMSATAAERVLHASKSRKWNSTQNNKFPNEFPAEHAANLEWIKKTEEETARRRAEDELVGLRERSATQREAAKRRSDGFGKWIVFGVIGAIVVVRACQRYREMIMV
jgi:hypothetical protein